MKAIFKSILYDQYSIMNPPWRIDTDKISTELGKELSRLFALSNENARPEFANEFFLGSYLTSDSDFISPLNNSRTSNLSEGIWTS